MCYHKHINSEGVLPVDYIKIIGSSCVLFLVIILSLAIPPKYTKKVLSYQLVIAAISALGLYGYGYSYLYISSGGSFSIYTGILRTVFDSCRMFVGANNWGAVEAAYRNAPGWGVFFWIIHLLAMTASASAIVVSLGSRLLKKIRMWLLFMHDITLIFGLTENTLEFGRNLGKTDNTAIVYVDQSEQEKLSAAANQMGAVFRSDSEALNGSLRFLKSIGLRPGKRKLHVFALSGSSFANQQYARNLLTSLETRGIRPEQTTLTLLSANEESDSAMQACAGQYGYGSLTSINEPEIVARMLIRSYPPYQSLTFDPDGKAETDFHGIIIGFGQIGQAVLRQLVMNSQFHGSTSRIAVFAPDYEAQMGWLSHECRDMMEHYNIRLFPYDGRSHQLYDYLEAHGTTVNYVAVCTGRETVNSEIGELLQSYLLRRGCSTPIHLCSRHGISRLCDTGRTIAHRIYTPEFLCSDRIDRMAMILNQSYHGSGTMTENWRNCSYFDRMSSRAAADFYSALLYCAGVTSDEALRSWDPQGKLLENLSITEHLRWVAFHYCMGFRPMTDQEFEQRKAAYLSTKEKDPATTYRITKDTKKRIHACMIPWEELDAYSQKENAITGRTVDYAEYDRNNVRNLVNVLKAMDK